MVVLHELAHWITEEKEHHSVKFFRQAFKLYDEYEISKSHYLKREIDYKQRAASKAARYA